MVSFIFEAEPISSTDKLKLCGILLQFFHTSFSKLCCVDSLNIQLRSLRSSRSKVRDDRQAKIPTCGASVLPTTQFSDECCWAHSHGKTLSSRQYRISVPTCLYRYRTCTAHAHGRCINGALKIQTELASQGVIVRINRIKRLRILHGIRYTHKKKFKVTTNSIHQQPVVRNLLDRQFSCTTPNQAWVAGITYIPTGESWLYLAAVKDLCTCEILGWSMDNRMTQTLVMDALTAA